MDFSFAGLVGPVTGCVRLDKRMEGKKVSVHYSVEEWNGFGGRPLVQASETLKRRNTMANQNNGGYQGQQGQQGTENIQAKNGQKDQMNDPLNKKNGNATNVGGQSADKAGRADRENRE